MVVVKVTNDERRVEKVYFIKITKSDERNVKKNVSIQIEVVIGNCLRRRKIELEPDLPFIPPTFDSCHRIDEKREREREI